MIFYQTKIYAALAVIFSLFLTHCANSKKVNKSSNSSANGAAYNPALTGLAIIDPRPRVSAFSLDELGFHVGGVRVGLQDYMSSESPAIAFFRPELADFVEILRCTKETIIRSGVHTLENIEIGTSSSEEKTRIMQSNDFWAVAEAQNGCVLIAQNYSDKELFIDGSTPTGGYRWLVRSCVNLSRLETQGLSNRGCSKQISVSPVLENFKNQRIEEERLALAEAREEQNKLDGLGRAVYYKTVEYNNVLAACQERENDRANAVQRKQAIGNIVGQGIGLAANLYAGGAGGAGGGSFSYTGAAQSAWNSSSSAGVGTLSGGLGGQLAGAINDLFASSSDVPRSCANAQKIQNEGSIIANQLEASHKLFAVKMDKAQAARRNRVGLENQ